MPRKAAPPKKAPTRRRVQRSPLAWLWPVARWALFAGLLLAAFCGGRWIERSQPPSLPSHRAVVHYAGLLASDVCGEIETAIQDAEARGEGLTAQAIEEILLARGTECRTAAWEPIFSALNDLQGDNGTIPATQSRRFNAAIRRGLEAVR